MTGGALTGRTMTGGALAGGAMTAQLALRYLVEYRRRPVNVILLLAVPVIFVGVSSQVVFDFARILGRAGEGMALAAATAGWATAFLAGLAGFFQAVSAREADRRLARAGFPVGGVVLARLASGLVLSLLSAAAALLALWAQIGIEDVPRTISSAVMYAVVYLGIGTVVGAVVHDEVNGSMVVLLIWVLDVFLGPALVPSDALVSRFFPTHFVTLVMMGSSSSHAGPLGNVGAALVWVVGAVLLAAVTFVAVIKPHITARSSVGDSLRRLWAGLQYGFRDYRRNVTLWVLLVLVPTVIILLSYAITPDNSMVVEAGGIRSTVPMSNIEGAIMVPIAGAFLAGLGGLYVVLGSVEGDRRLVLAGFRPREVLVARLGIVAAVAGLTTAVSVGLTAAGFTPRSWLPFIGASLLIALTYGMFGVLIGPIAGRLGGMFLMFMVPGIDVAISQNAMLGSASPVWSRYLPAHGGVQVLLDGAFNSGFHEATNLWIAVAWLVGFIIVAGWVFHRVAQPSRA